MDGNLILADQVVGESNIIEAVYLDHQMIDAPLGSRDAEGDCMLTLITMHEDGGDDTLPHANLIFDAATHAQQVIKTISGLDIFLTDNAVAQSAGAGLEPPMHPATRMKRLTG